MKVRWWLGALALAALGTMAVAAGAAGLAGALTGPSPAAPATPPVMEGLYVMAAATCPGLAWQLLAGIGTVESDNGTSLLPGVRSGRNPAGAEGPMQFEPATFAQYALPVPPGGADPPSPYDPTDAVYAAARMLCADGAADPGGVGRALFDYNHSETYVAAVVSVAERFGYGKEDPGDAAVAYALSQVGTPYRWGAEAPGVAFDCSGLVQAAYAAAGVALPRSAEAQFDAGPAVPTAAALQPGDLVFFGPGVGLPASHVGIVVDPGGLTGGMGRDGSMVDAPHQGAAVRVEPFPLDPGARWGGEIYLGATRP